MIRGDYKRLLFWSYGFGFEIFGTPPTTTVIGRNLGYTSVVLGLAFLVIGFRFREVSKLIPD